MSERELTAKEALDVVAIYAAGSAAYTEKQYCDALSVLRAAVAELARLKAPRSGSDQKIMLEFIDSEIENHAGDLTSVQILRHVRLALISVPPAPRVTMEEISKAWNLMTTDITDYAWACEDFKRWLRSIGVIVKEE